MKSKIKSISLHKFDYVLKDINSEEFELKGNLYSKTIYDEAGKTLSEIKFDQHGGIEQHYEYAYNDDGEKTSEKSYDEQGELVDHMEYSLDMKGKVLFAYKNYLDGSRDTITYRYDEAGNLIEKELRNDEDEVESLDKYAYELGKEVLHESWGEDQELVFRKATSYNGKGDIVEEKTWSIETDATIRVINEYNDDGQLQGVRSLDEDENELFNVSYKYDDKGQIIGVEEDSEGRIAFTHIEYDEQGNAVVQEEKGSEGEINSHIERRYDEEGNIVESEAIVDRHGAGMNQHYILKYEYEFYA
jgi:antitoxin component YwqK of YwqJK toxin-antitoxin module